MAHPESSDELQKKAYYKSNLAGFILGAASLTPATGGPRPTVHGLGVGPVILGIYKIKPCDLLDFFLESWEVEKHSLKSPNVKMQGQW